ncbi:MAG: hypothetical protein ABIZ56_00700 [Chthoniobacteraceae bacterium]
MSGAILQGVPMTTLDTTCGSTATEWRRAVTITFHGEKVKVLPLERIIRSKEFVGRPKDLAALPTMKDTLAGIKLLRR